MALEAGMTMALKSELIQKEINSTSCEQQQTPLHLAMAKNDTNLIQILIEAGASPDVVDENGNTPLHYATDPSYNHLIPMLMDASEVKNPQNLNLETPINIASRKGNAEGTAKFFKHGGDFSIPDLFTYPIIHAFEDENYEMAELILKLDPREGRRQSPIGQTPLHQVISEDQVDMICQCSHSLNAQDDNGDTAVHVMVKAEELDITVNLLGKSANPEIPDNEGNTPLHTAAKLNNLSLVQAMIVFGVIIDHKNNKNETARHLAANNKEAASAVLQALHMVGAKRCDANMSGCQPGCKFDGTDDGEVPVEIFDTTPEINKAYNEIFENLSSTLSQPWSNKDYEENHKRRRKDAMLTLDGGGMRGIITCQILRAIQKAADRKIVDCFDWVAGTSTGALTAAMLCTGYDVDDCLRQFFYMKNKVFAGPRPYDNENFEKLTRESFPEHIKMSDVQGPK